MGNLPSPRVQPSRPFTHTGVDYAGPLQIRTSKGRGYKSYKGYIAIFICLATKAIHIELATDLTTEAFIAAFKRFTARRGLCSHMYSDNASNFVGAEKQLKRLQKAAVADFNNIVAEQLALDGITWHFQPPASSHFGGLWEAGVKSVKTHLKKVVGNTTLTYEELTTVLHQIEAVLNSRPLCPMSNDITDLEILTPGHFLIGSSITTVPESDLTEINIQRLTRWQLLDKLKQDFWKRWSNEYLRRLQQRPKWLRTKPQIEKGDLVLLIEDNLPPSKWTRGRIVDIHPGTDGHVRVVSVRGPGNSLYKRAITKISLLPKEEPPETKSSHITTMDDSRNDKPRENTRRITGINCTTSKFLLHTLTFVCILGVALASTNFNISRLTSHPGIFFDKIGPGKLINGEWKIITYYNLTSYWAELEHIEHCSHRLDELCSNGTVIALVNKNSFRHCTTIISQIKSAYQDLKKQNEILNTIGESSVTRHKRSPFDFVGTIANELFGVLDQRAANAYKTSIEELNSNQQYHQKLLQQQTSILESTVNLVTQNYDETNQKFEAFNSILTNIMFHEEFTDLALQAMMEMIKLRTFQSAIIGTITEVHQGRLDPLILTPLQLQEQIKLIIHYLKPNQDVPCRDNDIVAMYKITKVKTIKLGEMIIFETKIPLVHRIRFNLYHVIPIPTIHHQEYVYIKPTIAYLMIAIQQNQYVTLSADEFNICAYLNGDHLCDVQQPIYDYNTNTSSCEVQLLKQPGNMPTSCQINKMDISTIWIPLRRYNAWLFAIKSRTTCNLICEDDSSRTAETSIVFIEGEGILELHPNCVLRGDTFTVSGYRSFSNKLEISFIPQFNLSDMINQDYKSELKLASEVSLSEIKAIKDSIQQHKKQLEIPITEVSVHDYHHYLAIYILLPTALIAITYYMARKIRRNITKPQQPASLPDP